MADKKPISSKDLRRLVKSFPWDTWQKALAPGFTQVYRDIVVTQGTAAAKGAGSIAFDEDDPFLQKHMTSYVGERIVSLERVTQKQVIRTIRNAMAKGDGLSPAQLQEHILNAVGEAYEDMAAFRALRIARTESAIVNNHGDVLGFAQAGFGEVDVTDGTDDPVCAEANGAVWSTTQALNNPIGHPNCSRQFAPHVAEAHVDESDAAAA